MTRSPIFIVGTARSGTTLTRQMLARHSEIFMGRSMDFLHNIFVRDHHLGDPGDEVARQALIERRAVFYTRFSGKRDKARVDELFRDTDFTDKLLAARDYLEMFVTFMEAEMTRAGKVRWGRGDPRDVFDLPQIFSFFPDAKVIQCARNPLDFLVSYRDTYKRSERRNRIRDVGRLRKLYHPMLTSLLWKAATRAGNNARSRWKGQVFLSRYEDLVADPESRVRSLCAFLEIEFEPAMLDVRSNNSSEDESARGIFGSSVGRWRETLPESDAFICQMICGTEMRRLGYVPATLRPDISKVSWQVITTPFAALRGWSGNRSWRRSTTSYLPKVVSAIARRG
jgi:hypothetical protein